MNDKPIVVANFKSRKTTAEVLTWLSEVWDVIGIDTNPVAVIVCPQAHSVEAAHQFVMEHNATDRMAIGIQNISGFGVGAYTGELAAETLRGIVRYAIIGHSERRRLLYENEQDVHMKLEQAAANGIMPIVCVSDETIAQLGQWSGDYLIAYEPPSAIGTGRPAQEETIRQAAERIKKLQPNATILYGGSVEPSNANNLAAIPNVSGFLVATASLKAATFTEIINAVRESR